MPIQNHFHQQIEAFHAAILDDCDRAARPAQSDSMVLRLRANALALAKVQLAMVALLRSEPPEPAADSPAAPDHASPQRPDEISGVRAPAAAAPPDPPPAALAESPLPRPSAWPDDQEDRVVTGDVLSRFASQRLMPEDSPDEVWQILQEADPAKQGRDPALLRAGFRSASR
jgi:hypothetical protein